MEKRSGKAVFNKSWLPEKQAAVARQQFEELFDWAAKRGAENTPALRTLIDGVVMSDLIVRELEEVLWPENTQDNGVTEVKQDKRSALIETYGRWQERRRRAMNELEEEISRTGTPLALGLADKMKPILKKAEGVIEDAMEFEARKRGKKRGDKPE